MFQEGLKPPTRRMWQKTIGELVNWNFQLTGMTGMMKKCLVKWGGNLEINIAKVSRSHVIATKPCIVKLGIVGKIRFATLGQLVDMLKADRWPFREEEKRCCEVILKPQSINISRFWCCWVSQALITEWFGLVVWRIPNHPNHQPSIGWFSATR